MPAPPAGRTPAGTWTVLAVQLLSAGLVAGWLASGRPAAPDDGLQQVALLMLDEHVPGLAAVGDRPTMVVMVGPPSARCDAQVRRALTTHGSAGGLPARYGLLLHGPGPRHGIGSNVRLDPGGQLARRLALPAAAERCSPGYVLLDGASRVRYRTYDPRWAEHVAEQVVLLAALEHPEHGT